MTRFKASAIHFLASASVVSVIFTLVFFIWYPGPTFQIAGALHIILVLIGVDLVLGPLLTLIVYVEGKRGLKFDLSVIVMVQLAALVYGSFTLYQERPYYLVFVVDRFNLVSEKQIDRSKLQFAELREKPFADLIRVFARMPEDAEEFQKFLDSVMFEGQPDLERRPEYWEPYANGTDIILGATKALAALKTVTELDAQRVLDAKHKYEASHPELGYLPIGTLRDDVGMLMDMETAEPLDVIQVDPW